MPFWTKKAWDALAVNGNVPGEAINRNRRITELYTDMYDYSVPRPVPIDAFNHPTAYEWAGIAAFASNLAGDGMSKAEIGLIAPNGVAPGLAQGIRAVFGRVVPVPALPDPATLLNYVWQGNFAIYMDMYPQLLAYQAKGLPEIVAMRRWGEIKSDAQVRAWRLIDDGVKNGVAAKVWEGTAKLAEVEQASTLQPILDKDPNLWLTMTNLPRVPLISPVPGDTSTFQSYRQAGDPDAPPDVSFGSAAARYAWFYNRMLPAWKVWRATHGLIDLDLLLNGGYMERP